MATKTNRKYSSSGVYRVNLDLGISNYFKMIFSKAIFKASASLDRAIKQLENDVL